MAAHVAHRLRTGGGWGHGRPTATVVLLALIPVATMVPALAALAMAAAVCAALIAYEAIRYRGARAWIRSHTGRVHDGGSRTHRASDGRSPPDRIAD